MKSLLYLVLDHLEPLLSKKCLFQTLSKLWEIHRDQLNFFAQPSLLHMLLSFRLMSSWAERIILCSPCPSRMEFLVMKVFFPYCLKIVWSGGQDTNPTLFAQKAAPSAGFTSRLQIPSGHSVRDRGMCFLQHANEGPHGQMLHHPTTWIAWNSLPYLNIEQNQPNTHKTRHTDAITSGHS